jgi:hypothetical protein
MPRFESATVIDREGSQATILERVRREDAPILHGASTQASPDEVLLRLPGGLRFWVPSDLLQLGEDGNYHVPFRFARLAGEVAPEEYAETIPDEWEVVERDEATGRVRLTRIVREREEVIDEPLLRDDVHVRRVPIDREVDGPMDSRWEGDTLVIPVMREELVVDRRWILMEELHVTQSRDRVRQPERVQARSERITVERRPDDGKR